MNEELSRVKSRRKSAERKTTDRKTADRKTAERPSRPAAVSRKRQADAESAEMRPETAKPSAGLSRKARHGASGSSSRQDRPKRTAAQETEETPSRSQSYPSERVRLSKIFVNSLYVLFIMLLGFLVLWGIKGAPELRTLW
ncbi:hypothetical protein [Paenibacillus sp. FSL R7-0273]|uniref:hypothetical protein n=1 Tax=Paenibacillus sp. FSL R7-0273 TaxID=1536772 RepID=UPI000586B22E|nr:hypothetical protein [Paenibacillus sp. FSL R7-0273]OMF91966.1 hypothetical protein BK144_14570 [Paenibacillus sp. FSL R7-0273]